MRNVFRALAFGLCLAASTVDAFSVPKIPGFSNITNIVHGLTPNTETRVYTDYYSGGRKYAMMVFDKTSGNLTECALLGDRDYISLLLGDSDGVKGTVSKYVLPNTSTVNVTTDEMDDFIDRCEGTEQVEPERSSLRQFFSNLKADPQMIFKYAAIFPGTKWCGAGNVARNYDSLGSMAGTDKCCRDHDHAIESISRGKEKHGLTNNLLYTMTKCADDNKFKQCLTDEGTAHAASVGLLYFNVLKTKCFDKRKQARCAKQLISNFTPCTKYVYDENSPEIWQTFDPSAFVPNSSFPVKQLNKFLHSVPNVGELLNLFS